MYDLKAKFTEQEVITELEYLLERDALVLYALLGAITDDVQTLTRCAQDYARKRRDELLADQEGGL